MSRPDAEQRLADALRAHASGAGGAAPVQAHTSGPGRGTPVRVPRPSATPGVGAAPALMLALLAGALLGVALALLSLYAPGVLPG